MNHFVINGMRRDFPLDEEKPFHDLLDYIRRTYTTESSLISSIVVNGMELDAGEEEVLDLIPIGQIRSLEILTQHPREMAEETLQTLIRFTERLEVLCHDLAAPSARVADLSKLVDGITIFMEALTSAKVILRITSNPITDVLEADLASTLRDILSYSQLGNRPYASDLLTAHLAPCFAQWREKGIPALIRSRDS